jgi:hypothetical protein
MNVVSDSSTEDKTANRAPVVNDITNDCEIVFVKMPPPNMVQLAVSYQLPETFFNYLEKPDCTGCIGCRSDDYVFGAGAGSLPTGFAVCMGFRVALLTYMNLG